MNIIIKDTLKKYNKMADEIVPLLLELLTELTLLEEEVYNRNRELDSEKSTLNIPGNQIIRNGTSLWQNMKVAMKKF